MLVEPNTPRARSSTRRIPSRSRSASARAWSGGGRGRHGRSPSRSGLRAGWPPDVAIGWDAIARSRRRGRPGRWPGRSYPGGSVRPASFSGRRFFGSAGMAAPSTFARRAWPRTSRPGHGPGRRYIRLGISPISELVRRSLSGRGTLAGNGHARRSCARRAATPRDPPPIGRVRRLGGGRPRRAAYPRAFAPAPYPRRSRRGGAGWPRRGRDRRTGQAGSPAPTSRPGVDPVPRAPIAPGPLERVPRTVPTANSAGRRTSAG